MSAGIKGYMKQNPNGTADIDVYTMAYDLVNVSKLARTVTREDFLTELARIWDEMPPPPETEIN